MIICENSSRHELCFVLCAMFKPKDGHISLHKPWLAAKSGFIQVGSDYNSIYIFIYKQLFKKCYSFQWKYTFFFLQELIDSLEEFKTLCIFFFEADSIWKIKVISCAVWNKKILQVQEKKNTPVQAGVRSTGMCRWPPADANKTNFFFFPLKARWTIILSKC